MAKYRPNVAAILRRPEDGKILVAERADFKGSWQFPQGGVDKSEDLIAALYREVEEEIGVPEELLRIVECRTGYCYDLPPNRAKTRRWRGQSQTYFLCEFLGTDADIDLNAHIPEFVRYKWVKPKKFNLAWLPPFKHAVMRRVFADFFKIKAMKHKIPKKGAVIK